MILGPIAETNLRRALMTDPEWTAFFNRPVSALFLVLAVLSLVRSVRSYLKARQAPEADKELPHHHPSR